MKVQDLIDSRAYYPSILLYGALRTGKTGFLGQMGKRGLLLDFDQGYRTLKTLDDKWRPDRLETDVESYFDADWRSPKAYLNAKNKVLSLLGQAKAKPDEFYEVIGLDSFTGMTQAVVAYVLGNSGHAGSNPTLPEWGVIINEIENFVRLVKGLPALKLFAGHEFIQIITDDKGNLVSTKIKLLCPGRKLPTQIAGFFDDIFYTKIVKRAGGIYDYILTSRASNAVECGTRTGFKSDWKLNDGLWSFLKKLDYALPEKETKS